MLQVWRPRQLLNSGAGDRAPGGRPGRWEWSWSKAEVEGFRRPAQSLAGRGAGARLSRGAGSGARSGASPAAPLLSIPPTEPSSAAEAARGRGGPEGVGWGRGEAGGAGRTRGSGIGWDGAPPASPPFFPGWGLCRGRGLEGTMRGPEAALGPGAAAVNGARCGGRPGEGTRC